MIIKEVVMISHLLNCKLFENLELPAQIAHLILPRQPREDGSLVAIAVYDLANVIEDLGRRALEGNKEAQFELHAALFLINELEITAPTPGGHGYQFDFAFIMIRRRLEDWADKIEQRRLPETISDMDPDKTVNEIIRIWKAQLGASHPIFDYVEHEAGRDAVLEYLRSDYLLNIRFYDLVVYSLIGIEEEIRFEVAHNLWDEVGQGNPANTHVQLYKDMLASEGIVVDHWELCEHLSWQGLAGYNLMMRHGLNKSRYFEALGSLAVTELADPYQYRKFVAGCRRVGVGTANPAGLSYYEEHISVDVLHGQGWLENVIRPQVKHHPKASSLILSGAYQRLNTALDYWDDLLQRMRRIDAAASIARRKVS
ncbi:MAG: iron-containing redox enzyme family protein [Hyphomicrobiales bacterium]